MSTQASDDEENDAINLFAEPEGFYQSEKQPTFATHKTVKGEEISLRLVGSSPLWGHLLWQAGRVISIFLENNAEALVHGKTVLELGAGAGLPSLICAIHNATKVIVTDYPDADLIANLDHNIKTNAHLLPNPQTANITAAGYLWGASPSQLLSHLPTNPSPEGFDLLILADILFNHSQHPALLSTVQQTLRHSPESRALVFFTPYRPWLYERDMAFFDLAREGGFVVEKVLEEVMERAMFPEDPGDERLRRTVFGYALRWGEEGVGGEKGEGADV